MQELYRAQTLEEGVSVVRRVIPSWVPVTTAVAGCMAYYCSYRVRMLLNKWRRNERNRIVQRYQREESQSLSPSPEPQYDSGNSGNHVAPVDPTVVTADDMDEFHMSLGLMEPRDSDLIDLVDKMVLTDPIPEGWILYRCSTGFLRFRDLNTEELRFFHPKATELETLVRNAVSARNQADIDFQFGSVSRGPSTSGTVTGTGDMSANDPGTGDINEPDVRFDDPQAELHQQHEDELFGKLLGFFVDKAKETAKIETEVQQSFRPSRLAKRSQSRRTQGGLTPSLRVTTTVPRVQMQQQQQQSIALEDSRAGSSTFPPLPPRRPPTPRSSATLERVPSSVGQAPRVPSFRAAAKTPSSSGSLNSTMVQQ